MLTSPTRKQSAGGPVDFRKSGKEMSLSLRMVMIKNETDPYH